MLETLNRPIEIREYADKRPYVVSADIYKLLESWARQKSFILPDEFIFTEIRKKFTLFMTKIFPGFELVPENELITGLEQLIKKDKATVISLDRVYYQSQFQLDITRQTNGLGRRAGTDMLLTQFHKIKSTGISNISLVDDVIFSGDVTQRIADTFTKLGLRVNTIYAGIGIRGGTELLRQAGLNVECVREFDEVIDEICERDFYPGIPFSGRLLEVENNIGSPYILPFGKPGEWASIPREWQIPLSKFCIGQTVELISEIESASGRYVTSADMPRKLPGMPADNTRFIDALKVVSKQI